jgi:hypothetical protein
MICSWNFLSESCWFESGIKEPWAFEFEASSIFLFKNENLNSMEIAFLSQTVEVGAFLNSLEANGAVMKEGESCCWTKPNLSSFFD